MLDLRKTLIHLFVQVNKTVDNMTKDGVDTKIHVAWRHENSLAQMMAVILAFLTHKIHTATNATLGFIINVSLGLEVLHEHYQIKYRKYVKYCIKIMVDL